MGLHRSTFHCPEALGWNYSETSTVMHMRLGGLESSIYCGVAPIPYKYEYKYEYHELWARQHKAQPSFTVEDGVLAMKSP